MHAIVLQGFCLFLCSSIAAIPALLFVYSIEMTISCVKCTNARFVCCIPLYSDVTPLQSEVELFLIKSTQKLPVCVLPVLPVVL